MDFDVFISYTHEDKPIADAACAALEAAGVRCWIAPRDIVPGKDYGASIIEAIERARIMVLIFSGHTNDSVQVKREIERAVSKRITLIPVKIADIRPSKELEYFLSTPHWLDALTPPMEARLAQLVNAVAVLLGEPGTPVPFRTAPSSPPVPPPLRPWWTRIYELINKRPAWLFLPLAVFAGLASVIWFMINPNEPALCKMEDTAPFVCSSSNDDSSNFVVVNIRSDDQDHGLTIRSTPDLSGQVIDTLRPNTIGVTVAGTCNSDGWCQVNCKSLNKTGWSRARYLKNRSDVLYAFTGHQPLLDQRGIVIRSGPSKACHEVSIIRYADRNIIEHYCERSAGVSQNWCRITLGAKSGWILDESSLERQY